MNTQPTRAPSRQTADPVPDPVSESHASTTGELGSEGGSPAELVQAERISDRPSSTSDTSDTTDSPAWGIPVLLITIILIGAMVVWYVASAMPR